MSHPKKRRITALAAGSATAVLASATVGMGAAGAAPTAASPNQRATTGQTNAAPSAKLSVSKSRSAAKAQFGYGRAQLAAKGKHVTATKVALPAKKKKKGKRSRVS